MLADKAAQLVDGLLLLPGPVGGVHHRRIQHPACGVDHRHLAAVGVAGVQAHGDVALYRGLQQQGLQIQGKVGDGPLAGVVGQLLADLPLQGGEQQPVIAVLRRGGHEVGAFSRALHAPAAQQGHGLLPGHGDGNL